MRQASLVSLLMLIGGAASLRADIIYDVNLTIGTGSATGYIVTDGTLGTLTPNNSLGDPLNIIDWDITLTGDTDTIILTGPLSGGNSNLEVVGDDFSATTNQLLFNFSPQDGGDMFFEGKAGVSGLLCFGNGVALCANGYPDGVYVEGLGIDGNFNGLSVAVSGTQVIATAEGGQASTPEPPTIALLFTGIASIGFRKLKACRAPRSRIA